MRSLRDLLPATQKRGASCIATTLGAQAAWWSVAAACVALAVATAAHDDPAPFAPRATHAPAECVREDTAPVWDSRWACAAAQALCVARRRRHLQDDFEGIETSCRREIVCRNSKESIMVNFANTYGDLEIHLELYCRSSSTLIWNWDIPHHLKESNPVYIASVRQFDGTWFKHDMVTKTKFVIENLPSDMKFQLRLQLATEEGIVKGSCTSDWISTLSGSWETSPAVNVTVSDKIEFSENSVNVSIQWKPNQMDMSCDYKVVLWSLNDPTLQEKVYSKEFSVMLPNLYFNNSYRAYVISGDAKEDKWGVKKAEVNFTTPSCLDSWNDNITICTPPPPARVQVTFEWVQGRYDMNISWIHARVLPQKYMAFMKEFDPPRNRSEHVYVNENVTTVIFENVRPSTLYVGCVSAISSAGNSTNCQYGEVSDPGTRRIVYGEIAIILLLTLVALVSSTILIVYICYHLKKKQRENLRRQFIENLGKEPTKEKICETTTYFDDEWEISRDRLKIGKYLGGGEFGIVHKGYLLGKTASEPAEKVAVKMLREENPKSDDVRQFQLEINIMKYIPKHPHIVSMIGCCTHSGRIQLIVEYCAFGNLRRYLQQSWTHYDQSLTKAPRRNTEGVKYAELMTTQSSSNGECGSNVKTNIAINQMYFENGTFQKSEKNGLQPIDLLSFARQIAIGMEFLALHRIVHRDLAARNVLVCSNKTVKISDFGLSKDIYEQNVYRKKGAGLIPVKWMAIESLIYQIYTTQSDIWSFGILLWEIVTLGGMPYPSTPPERIRQLLKTGYRMECPPNCSQELYDIMLSCWRRKPKDRPSFTELRNKLDTLLESTSPQQYLNLNILNMTDTCS